MIKRSRSRVTLEICNKMLTRIVEMLRSVFIRLSDNPSVSATACLAALYAAYYLVYVVKRPKVACGDKAFKRFLDKHCSISKEKFWPTWWCLHSVAQTLLRDVIQSHAPAVAYTEEYMKMPDGGEIRLDWEDTDKSKYSSDSRPTVLFLPGLTGSSSANYIVHMVIGAKDMGYRSVVFNNRGTGGSNLKTPRTYCAANVEDVEFVIGHIKKKFPNSPLVGVGFSLGGILLFNYLARAGNQAELLTAMAISPVYNISESHESLKKPISYWLLNRPLTGILRQMIQKNLHIFEKLQDIDTDHILKSETIKEFDERFTSKVFGYQSVDHYYTEASLHTKICSLARPVLCLSSADDPFAPEYSIPVKEAEENKNIAIIKTSHGGHIGFLEGTFPRHRSYVYRWFRQYIPAIFEHGIKLE